MLLTVLGGIAGVAAGYLGLALLTGVGLDSLPRSAEIRMDLTAIVFTLGVGLVVGLLVGLVPVINLRHMNLSQAFREEGRSGSTGRGARAVRRVLVASQVGFAFMLLIGAGLLLASFERVLAISPGFDPSNVLTARVAPPASRYEGNAELRTFADRLMTAVRADPGRHEGRHGVQHSFRRRLQRQRHPRRGLSHGAGRIAHLALSRHRIAGVPRSARTYRW